MHTKSSKQISHKRPSLSQPLVSVVIPVYGVERYIKEALDSVIAQTYNNLEIIVVDDQSPDNSIEIVQNSYTDSRIRIIQQKNRGLAGARNTGIRNANGSYIAFLDSDDFWQANKIEEHIATMQANMSCGVSFSASRFVDDNSESLNRLQAPKKQANFKAKDIFCRNPIGNGSAPVIKKEILEEIGFKTSDRLCQGLPYTQYFDENLRQSEDVDCWTRIAILTGTDFLYIDQPLTNYRVNDYGLSANVDAQFATWMHLLEKLENYAPEFARHNGPTAKAFQYRYLARRSIFQGQAKNALKFMWLALKTQPMALAQEMQRSIETTLAGLMLAIFPQKVQKRLVALFI